MVEISCEVLDTDLIYTKHHDYHFFNHCIAIFHVPAVHIWIIPKNTKKQNKLVKYSKKVKMVPNFKMVFKIVSQSLTKKLSSKIIFFYRVPAGTRQRTRLCRVPNGRRSAKGMMTCAVTGTGTLPSVFLRSSLLRAWAWRSAKKALPSVWRGTRQRAVFVECLYPDARQSHGRSAKPEFPVVTCNAKNAIKNKEKRIKYI
jgi:hypothetical protein